MVTLSDSLPYKQAGIPRVFQTPVGFLTYPSRSGSLNHPFQRKKREFSRFALNTGTVKVSVVGNTRTCAQTNRETEQQHSVKRQSSSLNVYFGENFTVKIDQWFKFISLIQDNKTGGVVHCDFEPNKNLANMNLSRDAIKLVDVPNAGGSSEISEMLSFEVLLKAFQARLLKTEMEVDYFPMGGAITDYVCEIFGTKLGVSVTRAMKFWGGAFDEADARHLLTKKLKGVVQSTQNSLENWNKQILHVWSASREVTNTLIKVYSTLPEEVLSNTVVFITTTTNKSNFIYKNK